MEKLVTAAEFSGESQISTACRHAFVAGVCA